MAVNTAEILPLSPKACLGYVDDVDEIKPTKENSEGGIDYIQIPVVFKGLKGSSGAFFNLLVRPEWFHDYDFKELVHYTPPPKADGTERKEGSMYKVAVNHVAGTKSRPSYLEILAGGKEGWGVLQAKLDAAYKESGLALDSLELAKVQRDVIREHLKAQADEGYDFLYTLKQRKDQDGELTDRFDVDRLDYNTEANVKRLIRRSVQEAKSATADKPPLVIAFETE